MAGKGKQFQKGHKTPGPGRPRVPEEIKQVSNLTKAEATALLSKYMKMTIKELEAALNDKSLSNLDHWAGRIVLLGIKNGDERRLNFMFDRLIGKVADKVQHTEVPLYREFLPDGREASHVINYPDGSQEILGNIIKD